MSSVLLAVAVLVVVGLGCLVVGQVRTVRRLRVDLADVREVAGTALVDRRAGLVREDVLLAGWRGTLAQWRRLQVPAEAGFLAFWEAQFEGSTPIGRAGDERC